MCMIRAFSLIMIVFMMISSGSAHAGMSGSIIDEGHKSLLAQEHGDHEKMVMDHDRIAGEELTGHQLGCGLGHCAIACGFLLQHFAFTAPEDFGSVIVANAERLLVGGTTAFEPPPPKV